MRKDLDFTRRCPPSMRSDAERALDLRLRRLADEIAACERIATEELDATQLAASLEDTRLQVVAACVAFQKDRR